MLFHLYLLLNRLGNSPAKVNDSRIPANEVSQYFQGTQSNSRTPWTIKQCCKKNGLFQSSFWAKEHFSVSQNVWPSTTFPKQLHGWGCFPLDSSNRDTALPIHQSEPTSSRGRGEHRRGWCTPSRDQVLSKAWNCTVLLETGQRG